MCSGDAGWECGSGGEFAVGVRFADTAQVLEDRPNWFLAMGLFAVVRTFGAGFQASLPLEQQAEWAAHAAFMNALESDGFVVLGGPLMGSTDALLIFRAESPEQIMRRLEDDPWTRSGMLRVSRISAWDLRLGSL